MSGLLHTGVAQNDRDPPAAVATCQVTGASVGVLVLALVTVAIALLSFVFNELIYEPASMVALLVILLLSVGLDLAWTRSRDRVATARPV